MSATDKRGRDACVCVCTPLKSVHIIRIIRTLYTPCAHLTHSLYTTYVHLHKSHGLKNPVELEKEAQNHHWVRMSHTIFILMLLGVCLIRSSF